MANMARAALTLPLLLCLLCFSAVAYGVFVSNLNAACLRCLCFAITGCNATLACSKGYCGPFYISRVYWADAGKPVFPEDDPERAGAYQDCAKEYNCAASIVTNYMARFGRDCNRDGVTNCDDYAMIHYNGGFSCETSLEGTNFSAKYEVCRPGTLSDV
ncbi:lysozyme 2-like [Thrips palmi]|uniref:lysozyme n=1 Tax=Thrips palmi TaxID=161013 RepID=A0A6P8Z472_THRPL|nr:lysozyme 2-like [Thrips palmi]